MTKSIIAGLVALVLVVGCGVLEVVLLKRDYKQLHEECVEILALAQSETLTTERYNAFRNNWVKLREKSELLLPHTDVYEINLRMAEAQAYVEQGDLVQFWAQIAVVEELLQYVPHLMTPNINHIL